MVHVVTFKPGVRWDRPSSAGVRILAALDRAATLCRTTLTITCGTEGHPAEDPHTRGEAFDVSVAGLEAVTVLQMKTYLEQVLGRAFTVLYECRTAPTDPSLNAIAFVNYQATAPHFHIQPKRGTTWPPTDGTEARPA